MTDDQFTALTRQLEAFQAVVQEQFLRFEDRFEKIDARFAQIDERFEKMDRRFERFEDRFDRLSQQVETKVEKLTDRVRAVETEVHSLGRDFSKLQGAIEHMPSWSGLIGTIFLSMLATGGLVFTILKFVA